MGHNAEVRKRSGSVYAVTDGRVRSYCGVTSHPHLRANKPGQMRDNDGAFCFSSQLRTEQEMSIPAEMFGVLVFGQIALPAADVF